VAEGDALPLILDTDVGLDVDDAIALCYAALDPRIDLRAVTTVNGDTQQRACVARALLRLCGREDVPVGAGAALPLDGRAHALMPVGHVDTDEVQGLVPETHAPAHDVLAAALEAASSDQPVTICTIGAVTNVASFLAARPDLLDRVARIQMMGGCLRPWRQADGGEGSPFEFNAGCDPLALSLLFSLPVPVGVIPIDVTIGAFFSDADRAAIGAGGRLGRVLDVLMNNFTKLLAGFMPEAEPKVRLHDPLAVATLVQPELAGFQAARAAAFGAPGRCRIVETPYGRPIDGCRSVDDRALATLMVQTLTSRAGA
jgi:pyrimidine-specific ribonucleoside hydrolase